MISIIIPSYNHCEDLLKPCIESIIRYTDLSKNNVEVIVVANGCTDNTHNYLTSIGCNSWDPTPEKYCPFKTVWFDNRLGFPKAINEGMKAISDKSEFVILLNNDCVLLQQAKDTWLDILLAMFNDPKVGVAGPLKLYENNIKQYYIHFFIAMIKREVINKIGMLDEVFGDGNCEDTDYSVRAKLAGYKIANVPVRFHKETTMKLGSFPIFHAAHVTVAGVEGFDENIRKNIETLRNRYSNLLPEPFETETIC